MKETPGFTRPHAAVSGSRPRRWRIGTTAGTSDSPTRSSGRRPSSNSVTSAPWRARKMASADPAGPAPTMAMRTTRSRRSPVTARSSEDLAARCLRGRFDNGEIHRNLVRRQRARAVRPQRVEVRARRQEGDLRPRHLIEVRMWRAEHPGLLDPRELVDALLHFLGEKLEPRDEDDRLLAALKKKRAVLVEAPDVPREKPAVARDLLAKPPGRVVRGEETLAPHADFPRRPGRQPLPRVREHGHVVPGYRAADRAGR